MSRRIPFVDLRPGEDRPRVTEAISRVVEQGWFVLGPEVEQFEQQFATACGAACAVGVGSGTDALTLILRALGIGAGDEVITTPLSAAYTALAVLETGARPVFADIDPVRLTLDPATVEARIGPRTRAILPVHLYGQPADMIAFERLAERHALALVEDCCQAHLATCAGRPVGAFGTAAAFSFYPTKNLGGLGDGGAVTTNDQTLADRVRRLRNGGQVDRYRHVEPGVNSRLDEIQAAVLRVKLGYLPRWTTRRRALAARYREALSDAAVLVPPEVDTGHVYHLFPVLSADRQSLRRHLDARQIETLIHYPLPITRQPALEAARPLADEVCARVFSLPLHPGLDDPAVAAVSAAIAAFRAGSGVTVGRHP